MKKLLWAGTALAALVLCAASAPAGDGCCGSCCASCCAASCEQIVLNVKASLRTEKVCLPTVPEVNVIVKEEEGLVPVTRCVPVCVTDPCTGCTHTEYKNETVMEKAKNLCITILPPKPGAPRTEERVKGCVTVTIDHVPGCSH
jgi:hypothetical protein